MNHAAICASCDKPMKGSESGAYLPDAIELATMERDYPIVCARCLMTATGHLHAAFYPDCPISWHDLWDHRTTSGKVAILRKFQRRQIKTGADLDSVEFTDGTARDILYHGQCDPNCMLALGDDDGCKCVCDGEYHGRLADVSLAPTPRHHVESVGMPDHLRDALKGTTPTNQPD